MDKNIGRKLDGRYEIQELIGVGGMADVYRAADLLENRTVAVKILKNEFSDSEDFLRRFRNESKAIAVLSHPNIVKIYDVGFNEHIQYLVMEYIDGVTLNEYMEHEGALKWREAIHFTTQILRALQHAHDRGIVHRDIKPQNIMLLPDGAIKVMDFGIARFAREQGKTMSEKAIGSVHYISPEQAKGDLTDERSDIYSVGVMLYEMLTGQKPFEAENPVSVALMHMQAKAKRPMEINDTIPEGLEEITIRAMQKDSAKRYQTAIEMIQDIESFKKDPSIVFEYKYLTDESATRYFDIVGKGADKPVAKKPVRAEEEYQEEEARSPIVPILAAIATAFVLIAAVVISFVMIRTFSSPDKKSEFDMPNLVATNYLDAKEQYGNSADYKLNIQMEVEELSEYEAGIIFDQDIQPGRPVKWGATIRVKVSTGLNTETVPDVVNKTYEEAASSITKRGFVASDPISINDDNIAKGRVVSTIPPVFSTATPGSTIQIYVSLGPAILPVIVPDLVTPGYTQEEAEKVLREAKLSMNPVPVDSEAPLGMVVGQGIAPGETINSWTVIDVQISTGQAAVFTLDMPVSIPSSARGSYRFYAYIDGELVQGPDTIDTDMTKTWVVRIKDSGTKTLVVEVQDISTTSNPVKFAEYEILFSDTPSSERKYYNEDVFRGGGRVTDSDD